MESITDDSYVETMLRENAAKEGARNTSAIVASARWKCLEESVEKSLVVESLKRTWNSMFSAEFCPVALRYLSSTASIMFCTATKVLGPLAQPKSATVKRPEIKSRLSLAEIASFIFSFAVSHKALCEIILTKRLLIHTYITDFLILKNHIYLIRGMLAVTLRTISSNHDPLWSSCHGRYLFFSGFSYLLFDENSDKLWTVYTHIYTVFFVPFLLAVCFLLLFYFA